MTTPQLHRPAWHREPWAWLIIALPMTAVIAGFTTLYLAIRSDDGLVVDDYYKEGMAINATLARDELAQARNYDAALRFDEGRVTVTLTSTAQAALPSTIRLSFIHATRAGLDQALTIPARAPGVYTSNLDELPAGHWYVHIETPEWRLLKELQR